MPKIAQKRAKDFSDQKNKIAGEHFGEKVDEMFYVHVIATSPSYQGRGHGGALMDSIAQIADGAGKDAWLISSGPHNVPFYKFHRYESVGQIRMGKNDLLWFKGEIVCDVMVRKSRKVFQNQFSDSGWTKFDKELK
ncbi:hypothetical protein SISNIDRAFT_227114 [Sistotremastrum niveocremeum HHB9708]|uniref:N-acetyltransferase domain-containing protein n=1 Tax=Sistotremastrum niveocremeum HHB9708 TaxID=1314777 RepID=A0A164QC59_9AGAM|nr:hypothetical protein SISNIDRAFT_227114 [Sistotremastrum niveocremeum HHB9708]